MTTKEKSYLLKEEDITNNGYQGLVTKLLDENFELLLGSLIKETNQEVIKGKTEKKITKQNPQAIIQGKAEIYILQEWKQAFLNKKLEPRKYPRLLKLVVKHKETQEFINQVSKEADLKPEKKTISKRVTEIEYKIANLGTTRTRRVQRQVEAFPEFNVLRVIEEEYRLEITREELATVLLYCKLAKQEKLDKFLRFIRKSRYQVQCWISITSSGLENYIPEYDGTIAKYKEWRDKVEEAFNIKGISKLMIFGRYSGNFDDGYTHRAKNHDGSADDATHPVTEFVVNFNRQVFAVIATKLKDPTGYSVSLNQLYDATGWHATAIRSAFKNGFAVDATTVLPATVVQVGFREILDEQFITEVVQETYQQQFLRYKFIPNWNDENSYDKYRQKFEELRVLANYQYATVFKSGPYTDYKLRLPPEIKERLTFQSGLGAITTEADFWQQTATIFHSI
ncbi:hypothetical protein F8M41_013021 [Gigaspora margarita]|uniref:Uncharacterized protein n=1 Tax=Gigaspora margarita TaxID=4874 RepID=A0A8H4ASN9_GIGMA|nr:hypothetical protein F8M41_013021 [Gigaspora margarita]